MSPKILFALLLSFFLSLFSFGIAMADTYDIPVVTGGKIITVTVEVDNGSAITVSTTSKGVLLGKPKARIEEVVQAEPIAQTGYWAGLMPNALETVHIEKDEFSGNTFYTNKILDSALGSRIYPYVGAKDDERWFCLAVILVTDEFLLFERATVLADEEKFTLKFNLANDTHDYIGSGSYFDAADLVLDQSDTAMLEAIARAEVTKFRFYTRNSSYDYTLSKRDKAAFVESLAVYELLGGHQLDGRGKRDVSR